MPSRFEALLAGSVLFGAGLGIAGYNALEPRVPSADIDAARGRVAVEAQAYLDIAPDGTCEDNVLSTMLNINAIDTPSDPNLTEVALDDVCGDNADHEKLATSSTDQFVEY